MQELPNHDWILLTYMGIKDNEHFPFLKTSNLKIAAKIVKSWLEFHLDRRATSNRYAPVIGVNVTVRNNAPMM